MTFAINSRTINRPPFGACTVMHTPHALVVDLLFGVCLDEFPCAAGCVFLAFFNLVLKNINILRVATMGMYGEVKARSPEGKSSNIYII